MKKASERDAAVFVRDKSPQAAEAAGSQGAADGGTGMSGTGKRLSAGRSPVSARLQWLGFVFLGLTVILLLHYIWGPSKFYMHSDSTDTILWAEMQREAGRAFKPGFTYAALLPFGANLWYVPLLAIGGYTLNTQLLGLSIFLVLLAGAMWFMFRGLGLCHGGSALVSACCLWLFSGSEKLREIFWGHVIYYSLGLTLLAFGLGLVFRLRRLPYKSPAFIVWGVLFVILSAGAATDGLPVAAIYTLPLAAALVADVFFTSGEERAMEKLRRNALPLLMLAAATAVGFAVLAFLRRGGISAGYANAYSMWSDQGAWRDNIGKFFTEFLTLFGVEVKPGSSIPMASVSSIRRAVLVLTALLILILPLVMLCRPKKIRSEETRFLLYTHAFNSGILLFLYVFGRLSIANWRLVPLLGTGMWATAALLWDQLQGLAEKDIRKALASSPVTRTLAVLTALVVTASAFNLLYVSTLHPAGYVKPEIGLNLDFMKKEKLEYGFATFWNANIYTLLTDSQTKVRDIDVDGNGIHRRDYQSDRSWYKAQPGVKSYFLLLSEEEFNKLKLSAEWRVMQSYGPEEHKVGKMYFLIFDERLVPLLEN